MENLHFLRYTHTDTHTYGYYIIRIENANKILFLHGSCSKLDLSKEGIKSKFQKIKFQINYIKMNLKSYG